MRVLITGAGGFLGSTVAEEMKARGHQVSGLGASGRGGWPVADLRDPGQAVASVAGVSPEAVIHMAGQSSPEVAEADPAEAFRANASTTWNLLEAVSKEAPKAFFVLVSSAAIYARPDGLAGPTTERLGEEASVGPGTVYGASKAAAEMVTGGYSAARAPAVAILRTFNLIGPGQRQGVASILTDAARDGVLPLPVWNPEAVRDFTDVRDAARAVALVAENRQAGTFNLCSGRSVTIASLARRFAGVAGMDPEAVIPGEREGKGSGDVLVGDPDKLRHAIGWEPEIPLEESIRAMLPTGPA